MTHCISLQWSEHESSYHQLALQGSTKHLWSLWGASRTLSFVAGPTEEIFWLCVSRGGHWLSVLVYWICFLFWNFGNFRRWVSRWQDARWHLAASAGELRLGCRSFGLPWSCARISPNYTETQFVPHFLNHWTILLGISHLEWFIEWYEHIYSAIIYRVYYGLLRPPCIHSTFWGCLMRKSGRWSNTLRGQNWRTNCNGMMNCCSTSNRFIDLWSTTSTVAKSSENRVS